MTATATTAIDRLRAKPVRTAIEKHRLAVMSGHVTRTNVIGIRKALNAFDRDRKGYSIGRTSPAVCLGDVIGMHKALADYEPAVSDDLAETGRRILQDKRYSKRWTEAQRAVIASTDTFRLTGFVDVDNGHYVPVYRACGANGDSFLYYVVPWQTAHAFGLESGPIVLD